MRQSILSTSFLKFFISDFHLSDVSETYVSFFITTEVYNIIAVYKCQHIKLGIIIRIIISNKNKKKPHPALVGLQLDAHLCHPWEAQLSEGNNPLLKVVPPTEKSILLRVRKVHF